MMLTLKELVRRGEVGHIQREINPSKKVPVRSCKICKMGIILDKLNSPRSRLLVYKEREDYPIQNSKCCFEDYENNTMKSAIVDTQ